MNRPYLRYVGRPRTSAESRHSKFSAAAYSTINSVQGIFVTQEAYLR